MNEKVEEDRHNFKISGFKFFNAATNLVNLLAEPGEIAKSARE